MSNLGKKLKRVVIKEELLALTGDWLQALILNQFLYWGQRVKDFDAFILEERLHNDNPDLELTHGWIWKSVRDLKDEIMVDPLSDDTVRRRITALVKSGWLEERRNPKHKWDRTLQYRPNIVKIQQDLQALGYALDGYPLLTEISPIPHGAESKRQGADSTPGGAESKRQGAATVPEITLETTPEITPENGGGKKTPPVRPPDTHSQTDLPDPQTQMAMLFPSGGSSKIHDFERSIATAGWDIRRTDIRRAAALFLRASGLPIPNDDSTRKDWIKSLNRHVNDFGIKVLEELYPATITHLGGQVTISRPGSLTNTLAAVCADIKNGGNGNATHQHSSKDQGSTVSSLTPEQRRACERIDAGL